MKENENAPLTDDDVDQHVQDLRSLLPSHAGLVGATRGAAPAAAPVAQAIPDHALAAAIQLPVRPKGMPIGQWLQILAAIIATFQHFFPGGGGVNPPPGPNAPILPS